MINFTPYEKMSKKKKRELNRERRTVWGISPITRKPLNPKAYKRKKLNLCLLATTFPSFSRLVENILFNRQAFTYCRDNSYHFTPSDRLTPTGFFDIHFHHNDIFTVIPLLATHKINIIPGKLLLLKLCNIRIIT